MTEFVLSWMLRMSFPSMMSVPAAETPLSVAVTLVLVVAAVTAGAVAVNVTDVRPAVVVMLAGIVIACPVCDRVMT